jgi:hypothetical protein
LGDLSANGVALDSFRNQNQRSDQYRHGNASGINRAGGLGEPILSGLNLNDHVTILEGAIPAALLALLVQWFFDVLDRVLIPKDCVSSGSTSTKRCRNGPPKVQISARLGRIRCNALRTTRSTFAHFHRDA